MSRIWQLAPWWQSPWRADGTSGSNGANGADGNSCSVEAGSDAGSYVLSCDDGTSVILRDGSDGTNGTDGTPGSNGVSCTIEEVDATSRRLICTDGTNTVIRDGEDGSSCSVADNGDGTKTITCEDGTSVTVRDGEDGEDGTSCTVAENGDGTASITCSDGTSVVLRDGAQGADGADGTSCSVVANAGGSFTLSCTDGTSVTWSPSGTTTGCTITHSGTGYSTLTCGAVSTTWFVCEPSTFFCDDVTTIYACNATGSALALHEVCVVPGHVCDPVAGVCGPRTRLVDGSGPNNGRLEVLYNGEWRGVCDDSWTQTNSDVVCRELGFQTGVEFDATNPNDNFWIDDATCAGTELSIHDCSFPGYGNENCSSGEAVGLTCS